MVPPYPYSIIEDHRDVPLEDCWYARPQLFFTCHLRPIGGRLPKNGLFKTGPDDLLYHLVFFNTFEELKLPIKGPMEDAGVISAVTYLPLSLRGSGREHYGQSPPFSVVSGGQLHSDSSSLLQQAQGYWLPNGLCRLCGSEWQAWQQCV